MTGRTTDNFPHCPRPRQRRQASRLPALPQGGLLTTLTKQAGTGTWMAEVIRRMGISEQTFCRWKKVYDGLGAGELQCLKLLEEENRKLKQLVADLSLDKHILQDVLKKSPDA